MRKKVLVRILIPSLVIYLLTSAYLIHSQWLGIQDAELNSIINDGQIASLRAEQHLQGNASLIHALSLTLNRKTVEEAAGLGMDVFPHLVQSNSQIRTLWLSTLPHSGRELGKELIYSYSNDGTEYHMHSEDYGDFTFYSGFRDIDRETLRGPYTATTEARQHHLVTVAAPVTLANRQRGIVAMDVSLGSLGPIISSITPILGANFMVVSGTGFIAAHTSSSGVGLSLRSVLRDPTSLTNVTTAISNNQMATLTQTSGPAKGHRTIVIPINHYTLSSPWGLVLLVPAKHLAAKPNQWLWISIPLVLLGALALLIATLRVARGLNKPIKPIAESLGRMARGELSRTMLLPETHELDFAEITNHLNAAILGFRSKIRFANDIENGRLDSELVLLSESDRLGKSLLDMRQSLKNAEQEQLQQREQEKQAAWFSEGSALFGRILSDNSSNLSKLTDESIKHLVKYLNINQGGLFLVSDGNGGTPYIELVSSFAWNRQKYIKKRLAFGESLAGSCILEREVIELTEIPQDYVTIASGLGETNPSYIIVAPLICGENVLGVLELASLRVLQKHEVEFVKSIALSIASAIQSVKVNEQTKQLLEKTQRNAEEMKSQEEEMRQNMEELLATQEELQKRETAQKNQMDEMEKTYAQMEQGYNLRIDELTKKLEYLELQLGAREQMESVLGSKPGNGSKQPQVSAKPETKPTPKKRSKRG